MAKLSRRDFLSSLVTGSLAVGSLPLTRQLSPVGSESRQPRLPASRVVRTHSSQATTWDYVTGWYGDYVNQAVVDWMTDQGVMALTGLNTPAQAWQALIPAYTAGQKVAIKINLNNAGCSDDHQVIDALPQPINSAIRGLKSIGVAESDIWVYDVTNGWHTGAIPARLVQKVTALYPAVQFHAGEASCSTALGYSSTEVVHFNVPPEREISDRPLCEALVRASYLINMPIMKKHGMAGVTLGFKNHFGSIDHCDYVHWSVDLGDGYYLPTYSGLVDLYNNPHIKDKTVLTIGDGLYGARIDNYQEVPSPWPTFGGHSPNSLFFSRDPVASDCVMYDFLAAEGGVPDGSDHYLQLAQAAGLGTFEHWDVSHQYHTIDYRLVDQDQVPLQPRLFLPLVRRGS